MPGVVSCNENKKIMLIARMKLDMPYSVSGSDRWHASDYVDMLTSDPY